MLQQQRTIITYTHRFQSFKTYSQCPQFRFDEHFQNYFNIFTSSFNVSPHFVSKFTNFVPLPRIFTISLFEQCIAFDQSFASVFSMFRTILNESLWTLAEYYLCTEWRDPFKSVEITDAKRVVKRVWLVKERLLPRFLRFLRFRKAATRHVMMMNNGSGFLSCQLVFAIVAENGFKIKLYRGDDLPFVFAHGALLDFVWWIINEIVINKIKEVILLLCFHVIWSGKNLHTCKLWFNAMYKRSFLMERMYVCLNYVRA